MTTSVSVPCPKVFVPTAEELEKVIISIGNKYGWQYFEPIEEILGAFPLSHTWDKINFDVPELEWEKRIQCMVEEFKLFPAIKIAEAISKLGPIELVITDPIFGVQVDILRLINDPAYKGSLATEFATKFDEFKALLPQISLENWDGTDGIDNPALLATQMFKEMIDEVKKMITQNIYYGFLKLIELFEEAWELFDFDLPLTIIIEILTFDIDGFLLELKKAAKDAGKDFKEMLLEAKLPLIEITIGDLLNLENEDKLIDFPNFDVQKIIDRIKAYMRDFPQKLLEDWMKTVLDFLEEIKFSIPIPIPFDLCMFLEEVGFPKEISVSNLVLEGT